MSDSLGLSIGMTNLVAARIGRPPVMRRSVLTLFDDRSPEVGIPSENPNLHQPGLVLSGFVDRVGDPASSVSAPAAAAHPGPRVAVHPATSASHSAASVTRSGSTPARASGAPTP